MTWRVIRGRVERFCEHYKGKKFHALLCDPPYGMKFMGKDWDKASVVFNTDIWAALAEHLCLGAFGMAFASSRGWHRLAVAIEDAGMRIHPSIFGWGYGSGFPKSTRIDTQVDKAAGELDNREVIGINPNYPDTTGNWRAVEGRPDSQKMANRALTIPATPLAQAWAGHRYGLQAMKPAIEPLVIFSQHLTCEPIYGIIAKTTFLMEVLLCIPSNVPDADSLLNQIHQSLRAVVDDSAHGNVGVWELLGSVHIAGDPSASSRANSTLRDFVVGPALTRGETLQLARTILTGLGDDLSVRDMSIYATTADILRSIVWLWQSILAECSNRGSMFITSTATHWITDLKILESYLAHTILECTTQGEHDGLRLLVLTVESLLRSLLAKLPLLSSTIATESAIEQPAKREADQGENPRAGGSLSPIIVFQRPYEGKPVECITETGAGSLWIDGGRIGNQLRPVMVRTNTVVAANCMSGESTGATSSGEVTTQGRWPANFCLTHVSPHLCPDCGGEGCENCENGLVGGCRRVGTKRVRRQSGGVKGDEPSNPNLTAYAGGWERATHNGFADPDGYETVDHWLCSESCPVRRLGEQSGVTATGGNRYNKPGERGAFGGNTCYGNTKRGRTKPNYFTRDTGTAARFFHQSDWSYEIAERLAESDPVRYCAKASRKERDAGLDSIDRKKRDPSRHTGQPSMNGGRGNPYNRRVVPVRNSHPTIKPISLCKWLATLLLPPPEYAPRRILVPFAGVGSEMIGAGLAGWDVIIGVEMMGDYCDIAEARLHHWCPEFALASARQKTLW